MGKELTSDDIKRISLEGLVQFKNVCEKFNLTYFLGYGTLLGSVRHHGFIPWDDDIDVWMLREDYDKLISLTNEVESDDWELLSHERTEGYFLSWAKFCHKHTAYLPSRFKSGILYGVPIDIFPLDYMPKGMISELSSLKSIQLKYMKPIWWRGLIGGGNTKNNLKSMVKEFVANFTLPQAKESLTAFSNMLREWRSVKSESTTLCCIQTPLIKVFPKESFEETIDLEFEKRLFSCPRDFDIVLTSCYGDYMTPPPIEQRVAHHSFTAVFKEL